MDEIGTTIGVIIAMVIVCVLAFFVITTLTEMITTSICRDNSYPDAVHIKNQGWYCVGISESGQVYLVDYDIVYNKHRER